MPFALIENHARILLSSAGIAGAGLRSDQRRAVLPHTGDFKRCSCARGRLIAAAGPVTGLVLSSIPCRSGRPRAPAADKGHTEDCAVDGLHDLTSGYRCRAPRAHVHRVRAGVVDPLLKLWRAIGDLSIIQSRVRHAKSMALVAGLGMALLCSESSRQTVNAQRP